MSLCMFSWLEPRWRLIYVGGDDDTDAGARTRDHAHADAVDDAGADARQRRSVKYMQLPGRAHSASKRLVLFLARHEAKVEEYYAMIGNTTWHM